ncbi:hypothetical protein ACFE04_006296 [Oxalis oulophora]
MAMAEAFTTLTHFINGANTNVKIPRSRYPRCNNTPKQSYWASVDADVEAHLKQAITIKPPLSVFEPMHHFTFSTPKNTAPALCIAACELVGGTRHQAVPAAAALHLMHAATYAHEHLYDGPGPYSRNIELLTGDGLMPFGFELLTRSSQPDNPDEDDSGRILRVLIEITRATGPQGMIHGRYNEVEKSGLGHDHWVWVEHVCKKKEGVLHACGAACGAILGRGSEDEVESLRKFGLYVGIIKGIINKINGGGEDNVLLMEKMEELRSLAMYEVEAFDNGRIETILSLVDTTLPS